MIKWIASALAVSVARPKAGGWRVDIGGGFTVNSARNAIWNDTVNGSYTIEHGADGPGAANPVVINE